jgi:hypothetical protein
VVEVEFFQAGEVLQGVHVLQFGPAVKIEILQSE